MDEQQDAPLSALSNIELSAETSPDFDLDKYMKMAEGFDLSEDEKRELLTTLWEIMKRFVELGWGMDSVSILEGEKSRENGASQGEKPCDLDEKMVE